MHADEHGDAWILCVLFACIFWWNIFSFSFSYIFPFFFLLIFSFLYKEMGPIYQKLLKKKKEKKISMYLFKGDHKQKMVTFNNSLFEIFDLKKKWLLRSCFSCVTGLMQHQMIIFLNLSRLKECMIVVFKYKECKSFFLNQQKL